MRLEVSRSLQIETVFLIMLQYRTIRLYFSACCLLMKANKLFLVVLAVFFDLNSRRTNFDISSCFQRFYSKEVVVLQVLLLYETHFQADRPFKISRSTDERYHADVWGNRLPLPPKTKNNFTGIDISQPTPSMSLSVPLFSLNGTCVFMAIKQTTSSPFSTQSFVYDTLENIEEKPSHEHFFLRVTLNGLSKRGNLI